MFKQFTFSLSLVLAGSAAFADDEYPKSIVCDFDGATLEVKIPCLEWHTAAYLGIGLPAIKSEVGIVMGENNNL